MSGQEYQSAGWAGCAVASHVGPLQTMRQPFWALVKISRLIELVTEEEVSGELPAPLEVYLIG